MDTPAFSKPRLKLGRSSPGLRSEENTPIAGPSRFRFPRDDDSNSNSSSQEATPKLSATASLPPESGSGLYADLDPSARLRALIARNNATPRKSPPPRFAPSESDSEFEAPTFGSDTRSVAQESLRELFANATRSPGDTPQRSWRRRNSIDASEVEAVPRVSHARSKHKPKRHSKSDDETDKSMHEVSENEHEVLPRPTATFDLLRERLAKSTVDFFDGDSFLQELRELKSSRDLAATSTPFRTLQMPSHLQSQSNLMDQDPDMNNALDGLNSSYTSSVKQAQVPFPPPALPVPDKTDTTPPSHSANGVKSQARITDNDRPQSPLQRERSRNRPRHSMPNFHSHNPGNSDSVVGGSPANGSLRNRLSSDNDGFLGANHNLSRRNSSVSSYAEHRERMTELEKERNREREREWNKRHPTPSHKLTRPSSSLSLRSYHQNDMTDPTPRTRTQSQVSPFGIAKRTPPGRDMSLGRRHSSYGSPQIPPSPSASIDSLDSWKERQQEMEEELQHERERNWGSPHPKWPSRERRTSITSTSTSASPSPSPSPSRGGSYARIRAGSLNQRTPPTAQTLRSKGSVSSLAPSPSPTPQSTSPSPRPVANFARPTKSSMSHAARPLSQAGSPATTRTTKTSFSRARASPHSGSNSSGSGSQIGKYIQSPPVSPSPSPGREVKDEPERSVTPGVSSRFGWSFPTRSHTPVFSEDGSPQHSRKLSSPLPESRYSRLDRAGKISHIPVRASPSPSRPGHKRATTELNDAFGSVPPPKITVEDLPRASGDGEVSMSDSNFMHVEEDASAAMETTPVVHPAPLPVVDEVQTDEAHTPESSLQLQEEEEQVEEHVEEQIEEQLEEQVGEQEQEEEETENAIPVPDENEMEEIPSPPASPLPPSPTKDEAASALPSPPPESPTRTHTESLLSLETPPRKAASNVSRVEFLSPSPPRGGLPELPALPSFSEEEEEEEIEQEVTPQKINESILPIKTPKPPGSWDVSIRQPMKELDDNSPENHRANYTIMNTPKPPGAWAATPASAPKHPPLPRSQTDDSNVDNTENTGLLTPLPTLTRASTVPAVTPGTSRRKSILKVRFDVNQATDTSGEVDTRPAEPQPKDEVIQKELDFWTDALHAQKDLNADETPLPTRPETPEPAASSRKQRRPQTPGIRVLDSFGREKTEDEKTPKDPSSQSTQQQSPRNRSGVRLVDAMGHVVQEEDSSFNSTVSTVKSEDDTTTTETETDTPLSQSEALAKLRRRLASLSEGLRDADRSVNELDANDHRTEELQEMSRHAREERARIARRLEEINLRDWKSGALSSENNPLLQSTKPVRRLKSWMPWILSFLLVQVGIVLFAYHFSSSQARDLFLRTYFDPFHPYLHLYTVQPPPDEASITLSSILSGEGRLSGLATVIRVWQNKAWEAWNDMGSERRVTWPAT